MEHIWCKIFNCKHYKSIIVSQLILLLIKSKKNYDILL